MSADKLQPSQTNFYIFIVKGADKLKNSGMGVLKRTRKKLNVIVNPIEALFNSSNSRITEMESAIAKYFGRADQS